jgi:Transglutaminase-like superfamily
MIHRDPPHTCRVVPGLAVLLLAAPCVLAAELRLDARTLFEKAVSKDISLTPDGKALILAEGELIEDDGPAAGYSYLPNEERLSPTLWVKKELLIPDPRARRAILLVGPGGSLSGLVNGRPVALRSPGKTGQYWQTYPLPTGVLKAGQNEFILHGSGKVWIAREDEFAAGSRTRPHHPNRSARSTDAGKTWSHDNLGPNGKTDGEYCVRLFLDRHRSQGTLTLPVLDAGNLARSGIGSLLEAVGAVGVKVDAEKGETGRVLVRVRSGPTATPGDRDWSGWTKLDTRGILDKPAGRYIQVSVELSTANPLHTPRLKSLTVETSPRKAKADWTDRLKVLEAHNQEIVRTSIPFAYEPFDQPRLKELRARYRLDDVVKGAKGELELLSKLAAWASARWQKGHLREGYPAWDALKILESHRDGTPVGGFCQQYNLIFLQACESFGIPGRAVSIGPGDHGAGIRGGHEVVEVWSNDHCKWIYVDGNAAWYFINPDTRVPLSLRELRRQQLLTLRDKKAPAIQLVRVAQTRQKWMGLDGWPPFCELRLIPRSNFLEQKTPLPLNQGMRGWFWTGHHVWTDTDSPAALLYSQRETRPGNWDWTLNQAHFTLEATSTAGEVRVYLDTETPGFENFLADVDNQGKKSVRSGFVWKLHPGRNMLKVRPRNTAGRQGIASRVVLLFR